jgi:hypothetical protein
MGWSIGYDDNWKRDIGYGVPSICDHPGCTTRIDRGLGHVCGGEPYGGEEGCGLYFCSKHGGGWLCEECCHGRLPFAPKADTPEWIEWKLTDESWADWRKENPQWVAAHLHPSPLHPLTKEVRIENEQATRLHKHPGWHHIGLVLLHPGRAAEHGRRVLLPCLLARYALAVGLTLPTRNAGAERIGLNDDRHRISAIVAVPILWR